MPLPTHTPPLSPLKRTLLAAAAVLVFVLIYAASTIATFPYPEWPALAQRCSMSVTVVSTHDAGATQTRIEATTDRGETIEVKGSSGPAPGEQITVWRSTGPDGRFAYEMIDGIPPMRK